MKRKILFVDDEKNVLDGLKRMMHDQEEAWDMSFCSRAAEALELLQVNNFDAAIIDISMPGMTGIEMLSEIKSHPHTREIEVIILTGLQEQSIKRQALSLGASDLLNKPVLKEDLLARLRSVLRAKSLRDELTTQRDELEKQLIFAQRMQLASSLSEQAARSLTDVILAIVWYGKLAEELLGTVVVENLDVDLVKDNLQAIQLSGERAKQLLGYVLSLSNQEQSAWQSTDLAQLAADAIYVAKALAPRGLVIEFTAPDRHIYINGDPAQLFQLMLEIVLDAIEHIHAGSQLGLKISPATNISLGGKPAAEIAAIEISELKAPGPAKRAQTTADQMQLAVKSNAPSQARQAIAQRITKLHGGDLVISSAPGAGISLLLQLPLAATSSTAVFPQVNEV